MMPHAVEAERAFLGSLFFGQDIITDLEPTLKPEDFYRPEHRSIFKAALSLYEKQTPVDVIALSEELKRIGAQVDQATLLDVSCSAGTSANFRNLAQIIRDKSLRRRILTVTEEIRNTAQDEQLGASEALDRAEGLIHRLGDENLSETSQELYQLSKKALDKIESLQKSKKGIIGIDTGYGELNHLTAGLQPKDLIIIAGRPSMGKTAFALNLAINTARSGLGALIFSLEMSNESLVFRILSAASRVDLGRMRTGELNNKDYAALIKGAEFAKRSNIICDETSSLTTLELRARARRVVKKYKIGLIVVDYLQLMRGDSSKWENREREIGEISRGLKALAKELNVPVVALSQLNRNLESRDDKRPKLSDLRESGSIEQDADLVMFIYRDEVYNKESPDKGIAEIIIGKQRNGPIGNARLRFFNQFNLFENLSEVYQEPWRDKGDWKQQAAGDEY